MRLAPKAYVFLTNIPAPYRVSFYNELHKRGLPFKVLYMRETEGDRSWSVPISNLRHPFVIDHGFYCMVGRVHVHFNPRLIRQLLKEKGADIILAASWNDVDTLILAALKRLGLIKNQIHYWSEANYLSLGAQRDNALKRAMRRFVYNASTGAQISSGRMVELTMERWGVRVTRFVPLPNTIDEEQFNISDQEVADRSTNALPVFFMPVRLAEKIKGIMNFFECIQEDITRRVRFVIAGDGPDEGRVRQFIQERGLEGHIELVGFCDTRQLVPLYKGANVFVLPSYTDASPLALVEALRMRLPVLVSDRCGNHYEALMPGENGYLFDPANPASVRDAFERMMQRRDEWRGMGDLSGQIYSTVFDRTRVIENFVRALSTFPGA